MCMSDDVFRLGWLDGSEVDSDCLQWLAERVERYRKLGLGENDTVAIFVEPLLRGLGWDTLDVDQVNRESQGGWPINDLHLLGKDQGGNRKVAVVIEA